MKAIQTRIYNPVEYLPWIFLSKMVNSLGKKKKAALQTI